MEVWKSHPDIVGIEVSTIGRVRTLDKVMSNENGTRFIKGRILKQHVSKSKSYPYVGFRIDGKIVTKSVHRLVAQTFIPNPDNLSDVNHIDCDRTNNNVDNLEFCTASYNNKYREKYGKAFGHQVFAINLATLEVSHFRSQREAGRQLGFFQPNISAIIKGTQKTAGGYWFIKADDNAVDLTKQKLREIGKTDLTAVDEASMDFVSKVAHNIYKN